MKEKPYIWERDLQRMRDVDIDDLDESQLRPWSKICLTTPRIFAR
jgi:hypothetical protein